MESLNIKKMMMKMLEDYEKLRQEQLRFLEEYYKKSVDLEDKFFGFWIATKEIYSLRIDDLTSFANKYNLSFDYDYVFDGISFEKIRR